MTEQTYMSLKREQERKEGIRDTILTIGIAAFLLGCGVLGFLMMAEAI